MSKNFVLSFIAKDRPGVVDQVSEAVAQAGGNWLESRMVHLAEKFAGVARVDVPAAKADALKAALEALDAEGIHLTVEDAADGKPAGGAVLDLEFMGPDHPGIVHDISHCLAERGVSIEEMESDLRHAPMGGGILFCARARVRMPEGQSERELRDALESLANALMVDITLGEHTE